MTYFVDLSPYAFLKDPDFEDGALNVGWLDATQEFPTGVLPEELQKALLALCVEPMNQTRGYHYCPFCSKRDPKVDRGVPVEFGGISRRLGTAEIRVVGPSGHIYAAPDLIYHYVRDHGYLPPNEFVEALRFVAAKAARRDPD